jgi:hypothetical protein
MNQVVKRIDYFSIWSKFPGVEDSDYINLKMADV